MHFGLPAQLALIGQIQAEETMELYFRDHWNFANCEACGFVYAETRTFFTFCSVFLAGAGMQERRGTHPPMQLDAR